MITRNQAQTLSDKLKIDLYSVYREYVQLVVLNELFSLEKSNNLVFKGGTALRLIYASPRFSEDLDFNANCKPKEVKLIVNELIGQVKQEIPNISLKYLASLAGLTAKLYLPLEISAQDLTVKIDFSFREKISEFNKTTVKTTLPVASFALIQTMKKKEILAKKVGATLTRTKARDIYDLWWLLNTGTAWDEKLIKKKLKRLGVEYEKKRLRQQISTYPKEKLPQQLNKFLPLKNRPVVEKLPELLLELIEN